MNGARERRGWSMVPTIAALLTLGLFFMPAVSAAEPTP